MRIAFDMDGTICEGKYLVQPERAHETYMQLKPYDNDTIDILYDLIANHECYIITARSYPRTVDSIKTWLNSQSIELPYSLAGIITHIDQQDKWHLASCLKCDIIVDDSPVVWQCSRVCGDGPYMLLMDNPAWEANQACKDGKEGPNAHLFTDTYKRVRSWKELGERIDSIATKQLHTSTSTL